MKLSPLKPIFNPEKTRGTISVGAAIAQPPPAPLTVTINKKVGQADPTRIPTFEFDVHFSQPVTGFTGAGFTGDTVITSSLGLQTVLSTAGSGADYVVSVKYSGQPGNNVHATAGTITATIPAGVATAIAAPFFTNEASTSTDNVIAYAPDFIQVATNQLTTSSRNWMDMVQIGDFLFLAETNQPSLTSVDVTTPEAPYTVTQIKTPITGGSFNAVNPGDVATDGTQVFLSSVWQVRAMNVTNPAAMTTTGTTVTESTRLNRGEYMIYDNGYCYVANLFGDIFTVVDVIPNTPPVVVGTLTDATYLIDPRVGCKIGNYVFVNSTYGVVSIDVSTPTAPVIADTLNGLTVFSPIVGSMVAMGNYVVYAAGSAVLYVIDATDPTNLSIASAFTFPALTGNFFQNCTWTSIARWDANTVIVAHGGGGQGHILVNISIPTAPQVISASAHVLPTTHPPRILVDPPYVYTLFQQTNGLLVQKYVGP